MSLITLTTDFGTKDHFVGAVKGAIYSELPAANIVDITHQISPFNITQTAYVLKNAYKSFPKNTIHIVGVDSELSIDNKHLAIELDGHYFICPDNGLISMVTNEVKPTKIVEINIHDHISTSFPVLDVFVKVASHIARGGKLNVIGKEVNEYRKLVEIQPKVNQKSNLIKGGVIYIDNYGNAISNIHRKTVKNIGKGRQFTLSIRGYQFKQIFDRYNEIVDYSLPESQRQFDGEKLAIFNSAGFLEIAIYKSNLETVGGASTLLGIKYRDPVIIEFEDTKTPEFTTINQ